MSWRKIKAEYIAGGISQRELSEKYGVGMPAISKHSKKEKWVEKRKAAEARSIEKVSEKTAELIADNATLCEQIKTKLLLKLDRMIDLYPEGVQEMRQRDKGTEIVYRMRDIAAVYASLSDKLAKGQSADIEDLTPLGELLRDE